MYTKLRKEILEFDFGNMGDKKSDCGVNTCKYKTHSSVRSDIHSQIDVFRT